MSAGAVNALMAPQAPAQPAQQDQQNISPFIRYLQQVEAQQGGLRRAPMEHVNAQQLVAPVSQVPWQPPQSQFAGNPQLNALLALNANRTANPGDPNLNLMSMMMGMQTPAQADEEIPT